MYTRCKGCHTVHPVNAGLLARAGGKFRCSKCGKTGNALEALFDQWPEAGDKPPASGAIPELGLAIDLEEAKTSRSGEDPAPPPGTAGRRMSLTRAAWIGMALVVLVAVTLELAEYFDKPLLETTVVKSVTNRLGITDRPPAGPYRDLAQIHLVSRDLRSHPVSAGMLQLTATIVNRAEEAQPYPQLEVVLFDAEGQEVGRERFDPADYLSREAAENTAMTPQAYLALKLDLADPGSQAVGFELNFL